MIIPYDRTMLAGFYSFILFAPLPVFSELIHLLKSQMRWLSGQIMGIELLIDTPYYLIITGLKIS